MDNNTADGVTASPSATKRWLGSKRKAPKGIEEEALEGLEDDVPRIRHAEVLERPARKRPSRRNLTQTKADTSENDEDSDVDKDKAQSEARARRSVSNSQPSETPSARNEMPILRPETEGRALTRAAATEDDKAKEESGSRPKNAQGRTPLPVLVPEEMRRRIEIRERRKEERLREERNALRRARSGR